jgi:hypothetical protein
VPTAQESSRARCRPRRPCDSPGADAAASIVLDFIAIGDGDMRYSLANAWRPPPERTHPPSTILTRRETGYPQYPAWLSRRVVDTANPERPQRKQRPSSASRRRATDHVIFYNYVAGLLLERLAYIAAQWPGGRHQVKPLFGHVRGFDRTSTKNYFARNEGMASRYPRAVVARRAGQVHTRRHLRPISGRRRLRRHAQSGTATWRVDVLQPQHTLACWSCCVTLWSQSLKADHTLKALSNRRGPA